MDFTKIARSIFPGLSKTNNSSQVLGRDFLRYGNRGKLMDGDFSNVTLTDVDFYSGYSYAAINNRANKVSQLATNNIVTTATRTIQDEARKKDEKIVHPYLDIIDKSQDFTNASFWYDISTYLDLEGVYYLMAVRRVNSTLAGDIQEFKMLNPYEIRRIISSETGEVGGYVETRGGLQREIPKEMIIEMRRLNPFSREKTFAMADAAKDYQFALKQAADYTRSSMKNNISAPGILSTDVLMDDEMFANFRSRVMSQEKGAPLFANGSGAITWEPMQIDLDKAALPDISSINRDTLFAVTGVSKTTMGIEESGTTREVSRTQKDKFMEDHIMPQLQLILDALNQDYKIYYEKEYKTNEYTLTIDSPMAADKDAEMMDVEIAQAAYDLYDSLIAQGYDKILAAKYSKGEIGLGELGEPDLSKARPVVDKPADKKDDVILLKDKEDTPPSKKKDSFSTEESELETAINELGQVVQKNVDNSEASLLNAVQNAENGLISTIIDKITVKNAFETEDDIINASDKRTYVNELAAAIAAYYLILFPIYGNQLMRKRASEHGDIVPFTMNSKIKAMITNLAKSASSSHIDTVIDDILTTISKVTQESLETEVSKLRSAGMTDEKEIYKLAREKALEGANRAQIVSAIKQKYQNISQGRAKTIARTEANRAFNQSQFQADLQFLNSTGLMTQAYKKWETRNADACNYCRSLAGRPPIPFEQNFVELGGEITSTETTKDGRTIVKKLPITYEAVGAGNAHVNCGCRYVLIIK